MSTARSALLVSSLGVGLLIGGLTGFAAVQVDWDAPPEAKTVKNPVPATKESIEAGHALFKENCSMCHGDTGIGDGPMGQLIKIKADLTDVPRMSKQADGELFWKISKGKDPMPATEAKFSVRERWNVVNYVRTLQKKAAK